MQCTAAAVCAAHPPGIVVLQVDLMDILYRAAKHGHTQGAEAAFENHPAVSSMFETLVQKRARVRRHPLPCSSA